MLQRLTSGFLVLTAYACLTPPAAAEVILIDPDAYSLGANVTNMFPELTLSRLNVRDSATDVTVAPNYHVEGAVGLGTFSYSDLYVQCNASSTWGTAGDCGPYISVLELRFATPTSFVRILSTWWSDPARVYAFDAAGNLLGDCTPGHGGSLAGCSTEESHLPTYTVSATTLERDQGDISRIIFGGHMGNATARQISYAVPEPGTLGLLMLGLWFARIARVRPRGH